MTLDDIADAFAHFMDLNMLVIHGARERTLADHATLLAAASLRVARVLPTATGLEMIEATAL